MEYLLELAASPTAWVALATLVAMEVVLGIDNLIFISILTNKLPVEYRSKARRIGISMALIMLPMPLIGLWRSMSDVLQVAPNELDARVHAVMEGVVKERQFLEYTSYIAKAGRGRFVEIHVLVPPDYRIDIATADAIRSEVSQRLNAGASTFWLTIDFTADRRWL